VVSPSRKAELFAGAESSRRFSGSATGDERRMLIDILGAQRATLKLKCSGLSAELSLRSVEPSTLSLLGLVRHLADVGAPLVPVRTGRAGRTSPLLLDR
jgi:hypothetical protein